MINRVIAGTLVTAGLAIAFVELVGFHFFVRIFCNHPAERIFWSCGTRICERCGKEVTLWDDLK